MKFRISRSVFLGLLSSFLSIASAKDAGAVSSAALVEQALTTNTELRFYEAEIAAAKAGRRTAGQYANPELGFEVGHKKVTELTGSVEGDGPAYRAQIMQTFDFPGRIALRKAIAERDIALAELGLAQYRAQLANEVRARAGDVSLLKRKQEAARSVRKRFEELVAVLVQRDTGSVSAKLERRILEASLLISDRAVTDASVAAGEAVAALNSLCGRPADSGLELTNEPVGFPGVPSLEALKQEAAKTNFELQQKRLQIARQGVKIDLTKSERWGNITFGPYIAGERHYENVTEGGISLNIPLPLWNRNEGNIATEKARLSQAEAMLAATLRDIERDLVTHRSAYQSELDALARWKPETEREFQTAAEEADEHYRLGAVPASTYVEMQRQYLEAMSALIETRRNAWKHRMEIERLTGAPLK
jgi:cobalt-zinc-cadmium efflux system outer membrane protein